MAGPGKPPSRCPPSGKTLESSWHPGQGLLMKDSVSPWSSAMMDIDLFHVVPFPCMGLPVSGLDHTVSG